MVRAMPQKVMPPDELDEIIDGLNQPEKMISPKYFYDERGSQLFDEITRLPEYYPTETELGIMRANIDEIVALAGKQASLIEFGSGSSLKTRVLLEHLDSLAAYVPVDISEDHLLDSATKIRAEFPGLDVLPVVADFTRPFQLPSPAVMPVRNIVYFPGSTIGNFMHEAAHDLLEVMYHEAGEDGALLIYSGTEETIRITPVNSEKAQTILSCEVMQNGYSSAVVKAAFSNDQEQMNGSFFFDEKGTIEIEPAQGMKGIAISGEISYGIVPTPPLEDLISLAILYFPSSPLLTTWGPPHISIE